jgi:hypothetical protein
VFGSRPRGGAGRPVKAATKRKGIQVIEARFGYARCSDLTITGIDARAWSSGPFVVQISSTSCRMLTRCCVPLQVAHRKRKKWKFGRICNWCVSAWCTSFRSTSCWEIQQWALQENGSLSRVDCHNDCLPNVQSQQIDQQQSWGTLPVEKLCRQTPLEI